VRIIARPVEKGGRALRVRSVKWRLLDEAAIPSTLTRKIQHAIDQTPYALRNRIERFFNRAKHSRRVAAHHDKLIESFATLVLLACIPIWINFVHAA
jgi:transposase